MNFIKRLKFKQKILMMLLPALLGLLYFSALNIMEVLNKSVSVTSIEPLVALSAQNSLLVHELQKERGATAGFLGSRGAKFGDVLKNQRGQTNGQKEARDSFLNASKEDLNAKEVSSVLDEISSQLSQLDKIRAQVDSQKIKLKDAVSYYTNLNTLLLSVSSKVAHIAEDGRIANQLLAYYSFLQGKERAGIERAVLSNAFGGGFFPMGMYNKFLHLVTEQDVFLDSFAKAANPEQVSFFKEAMNHESVAKIEEMREAASNKELYLVKATDWFKQATERINQLKAVEDRLTADLIALTSEQRSAASQAIIQNTVIMVVVLLVVLIMGISTARLLTSQLEALVGAIDVAGRSKDLSVRAAIITEDELGASAERFNEMLAGFEGTVKNIEKGSVQLAAVAEETATTIEGNLRGLDRQHDETTLVATATEEMSATVQEVAMNTSSTSEAARQVSGLTDDGVNIVVSTVNNMHKLSEDMAQASQAIIQLKEDSNQISSVVDVIKSVAEQTNLLALNAAIEAARAGDQGRGFAVVADEVRTLAQRTQSSTEEIETIVSKFQTSAGIVSNSIELCSGDANQSVEQTAVMESKLEEIQQAIGNINDMCLQVSSAVEEQVAVTSEIADNARSINALADEGVEGGRQIATAADEQARLASELQALSSSFKVS